MKKTKSRREASSVVPVQKPAVNWWPWAAALAGLFLVFEAYTPALNGAFVLDDRTLPFFDPNLSHSIWGWVGNVRPLLMFSFWIDYRLSDGVNPFAFHATNVVLHFLASTLVALIAAKLLEWASVVGRKRTVLAWFSGALFLLHPLQTESVAYVASRSENLSALFYFAAFTVFLYRGTESMTLLRTVAILALFGGAIATKEHTLTLPALLLLTDLFWDRGGIRKNAILYGLLALAGMVGTAYLVRMLGFADTAGFHVKDVTPASYFFTQCRVIWIYARMFVLPFGQNVDPDIPISQGLIDHGAILGLAAIVAAVVGAWIWRKRYPLAAFGVLMFLLLLAPTSSFIPIKDPLAEHRLYLPFLGLVLISLEFLRRMKDSQVMWAGAAVLAVCSVLTYQRNAVWTSPLALWQDTVAKSPNKYRPRFQLAFAQYEVGRCPEAVQSYEKAAILGPADDRMLIDWALALDCADRVDEAVARLRQASLLNPTAHVYSQIGKVYASHGKMQEALVALAEAEKIDANFDMTYVYRGKIYEIAGDRAAAAREYQRALAAKPGNQDARDSLLRVSR